MAKIKINRRVFISFLSAKQAEPLQYYYASDKSDITAEAVDFVQEAFAEIFTADWSDEDVFLVFASPNADAEGAALSLKACFNGKVECFDIPHGNNEAEIWQIFDAVLAQIQERDQIFLDVTYGSRLIPTFSTTLLHYAKLLKNARIGGVFCGNHQASSNNSAPIVSLSNIETLESWISAADAFLKDGSATLLRILISKIDHDLALQIGDFTLAIATVRGQELCYEFDINGMKEKLKNLQHSQMDSQIQFILAKINDKFAPFQTNSTINGISATGWCVQHDLIQQGYTILQETLKSILIDEIFGEEAPEMRTNFIIRELANETLKGKKLIDIKAQMATQKGRFIPVSAAQKMYAMAQWVKEKDLAPIYTQLSGQGGLRNEINHAGINMAPHTSAKLKAKLESLYSRTKNCLNIS
jgi:hypothetical protein